MEIEAAHRLQSDHLIYVPFHDETATMFKFNDVNKAR